jgi:hypothetical protein
MDRPLSHASPANRCALLEAVAAELRDRPRFTDAELADAVQHRDRRNPRDGGLGA